MGGIHIFEKPCYREIRAMRGRVMRGLPVHIFEVLFIQWWWISDSPLPSTYLIEWDWYSSSTYNRFLSANICVYLHTHTYGVQYIYFCAIESVQKNDFHYGTGVEKKLHYFKLGEGELAYCCLITQVCKYFFFITDSSSSFFFTERKRARSSYRRRYVLPQLMLPTTL